MDSDEPILAARDLVFRADGRDVLRLDRLELRAGGISIILGPNGAGKSLALRLMHGILSPNSGNLCLHADADPNRQAMVFQKPVLLRRTVAANVAFALDACGRDRSNLAALLERASLTPMARQPARTLSGGEQQRLALIRALATEPQILFLDEPTASLDPAATKSIEEMIVRVSHEGTKIVMVTHNIGQARRLAADVVFFHGGRVVCHQDAGEFFDTPGAPEAEAFLAGLLYI